MKAFSFVALLTGISFSGPVTLLQTDFEQLPQGWVSDDEWTFGSFGAALCVSVQNDSWCGEFSTEGEPPVRYIVPQDADSVVISVDHWIFLSSGPVLSDASGTAMIQLWTSQTGWGDYVYYQSVSDTLHVEETVSTLVLNDISAGTLLGIRFTGELNSGSQSDYAEIIWQIDQLTITAHCSFTGLGRNTWGCIKTSL